MRFLKNFTVRTRGGKGGPAKRNAALHESGGERGGGSKITQNCETLLMNGPLRKPLPSGGSFR